MTKADDARELAGYVAPIVRGTSEALLRRRVKTYDRETGEVTGEVTMRQVIGGLAEVMKLDIEVIDGRRPDRLTCDVCGWPFEMPARGPILKVCGSCRKARAIARRESRLVVCECGCGSKTLRGACTSEAARRRSASMTPEQRHARLQHAWNARVLGQGRSRSAAPAKRSTAKPSAGLLQWHTAVIATIDAVLRSIDGGAQKTGADD